MVTLTLLEKIYGPEEDEALRSFQNFLSSFSSGLEAEVKIVGKTEKGWVQVDVSGSDTVVVTNYLSQKFGLAPVSLENLKVPSELGGRVVDSGRVGYGLYVDVGISSPQVVDVLIPLHVLRRQFVGDKKLSTRKIIEDFCLYDNFPLRIKLTRINMDKKEIEAELSEDQLATFQNWLSLGFDRVIALGASLELIRYALERSGSTRDVIRVDKLGFLEYSLLCKLGTEAPGIINRLGHLLPRIPLHAFMSRKIKTLLELEK